MAPQIQKGWSNISLHVQRKMCRIAFQQMILPQVRELGKRREMMMLSESKMRSVAVYCQPPAYLLTHLLGQGPRGLRSIGRLAAAKRHALATRMVSLPRRTGLVAHAHLGPRPMRPSGATTSNLASTTVEETSPPVPPRDGNLWQMSLLL